MITRMPAWQKAVFVINICTNGLTVSHLSLLYGYSLFCSWQGLSLMLWLTASEGSQLFRELLGSSRSGFNVLHDKEGIAVFLFLLLI